MKDMKEFVRETYDTGYLDGLEHAKLVIDAAGKEIVKTLSSNNSEHELIVSITFQSVIEILSDIIAENKKPNSVKKR